MLSSGRPAAFHPLGLKTTAVRKLRSRLLGFVPAGDPFRRGAVSRAPAADAALGFASLRFAVIDPYPAASFPRDCGREPLVGFSVRSRMRAVTCERFRLGVLPPRLQNRPRPPRVVRNFPGPSATAQVATPGPSGVRRRGGSLSEVSHRLVLLAPTPSDGPDVLYARRPKRRSLIQRGAQPT